jgi:hypothetical protein
MVLQKNMHPRGLAPGVLVAIEAGMAGASPSLG